MGNMWQDMRYGARILLKNPVFTLVAVLTLALGIGANTAIFSVVNAVLLRPLPFREPERVVMVWHNGVEAAGGARTPLAVADLLDWRAQSRSFESIAAFTYMSINDTSGETPERVLGVGVTSNFFEVLGVRAALGRTFQSDEDRPGAGLVVLLNDSYWRRRFGADPQVVGRALTLNGNSHTVIGVMPPGLNFPAKDVEIWALQKVETPTRRGPYFLQGLARLKTSTAPEQAYTDMRSIKSSFDGGKFNFNILPVNDYVVGEVRHELVSLLVAVTLVLLIAAANVANLNLSRSAARVKEISIRTALGAGRGRIIRQFLTESLVLAFIGGALGTFLAIWGIDLLVLSAPEDIPRLEQIGIDWRVLGWTALISTLTGIVCGLAPTWQSTRLNLSEALKEGGRDAIKGPGQAQSRSFLVVAELAMAVMLLVGAGLLIKTLWYLQKVDLGANPERVLAGYFELPEQRYSQPQQMKIFYTRLIEKANALPGVQAAALSNCIPPYCGMSDVFWIEGRPYDPSQPPPIAYMIRVSPDYFRTLGIVLRSGRYLSNKDEAEAPRVVMINEALQRHFFPGVDPIGKRLNTGNAEQPVWNEIVGVIGDVKTNGLAEETQPALYQTLTQAQWPALSLLLKTEAREPLSLVGEAREAIKSVDREVPLAPIKTMEESLSIATSEYRFRARLIALFAALALILACVGIYGVISHSVAQRTHEIGVRMALGAHSGNVLRLVIAQGIKLTLAGLTIGLLASFGLTRLMKGLLFGVGPTDPVIFIVISVLLGAAALIACYVPARRATKVDPMIALRHE